jgi:signal transduction histidine kinase
MNLIQRIFFIFIVFTLNLFAQEDLYTYQFNLDSTIIGAVSAEGDIYPDCETTYISFYRTFKNESSRSLIYFFDENFNKIDSINFNYHVTSFFKEPLVFDFDDDSFDEIVFAIQEEDRIWYLYFDPSNKVPIKSKIFEILLKEKSLHYSTSMIAVQLDEDDIYELILTINEKHQRKSPISGIWAVDIEKKTPIWENLTAENFVKNTPINIVTENQSFIVYSSNSSSGKDRFCFTNGNFFIINENGTKTVYNKHYKIINEAIIDTLSEDYSIDSVASIRVVDSRNNILWKRKLGGLSITTQIDTININNQKKILLAVYSSRVNNKKKSLLEIIDPLTGKVENRKIFDKRFKQVFYHNKTIYASFSRDMIKLDYELNVLNSAKSKFGYSPFAKIKIGDDNFLLTQEGSGVVQSIEALNNEMYKVAKRSIDGRVYFLPNSKLISVHNQGARKSKIYSMQPLPWYNKISPTSLRNLTISFLLILLVTMFLWVNTLRVSSKKIKRQKEELETTNKELKSTTSRLIQAEKLAVYGTIASGIAHEINSPLGAIINSAQRIKENNNIDIEKNINLIEKAGKRSKAIIEKLLLGTRRSNEDVCSNLIDVFAEWRELSNKQFENLGIKLETELICDDLLAISSTELNQIFTNILFNARDSIVEKNSTEKRILIKSKKEDSKCSIIIQDTGTGFSQSKLENPFKAFDTSKEKGKGTGLGLWVVNNILANLDGDLKINNYELGAEVKIIIPLYIEKKNE